MITDWKLTTKHENSNGVDLKFARVRWVRVTTDHAELPPDMAAQVSPSRFVEGRIPCEFDHPDAMHEEIAGALRFNATAAEAAQFEVGKTYRVTFG